MTLEDHVPVPAEPPLEWFTQQPDWFTPGDDIHVVLEGEEAGRVAGTFARFDVPHNSFQTKEVYVAPSPSKYKWFHQGHVITADGTRLPVGVIGHGDGHAPLTMSHDEAMSWYAKTHTQMVIARAYDIDRYAIILGALVPGVSYRDALMINRSALSGDWRWSWEHNQLDCIGPCLVSRPGIPMELSLAASSIIYTYSKNDSVASYSIRVPASIKDAPMAQQHLAAVADQKASVSADQKTPTAQPVVAAVEEQDAPQPEAEQNQDSVEQRIARLESQLSSFSEQVLSQINDLEVAITELAAVVLDFLDDAAVVEDSDKGGSAEDA